VRLGNDRFCRSYSSGLRMTSRTGDDKIRVLVVDDSVLMGIQITKILNADPRIEVVARAKDGVEALQMVEKVRPDVVTLDVEMPRMDGITALKHLMVRHPVPVVMLSSLTREGAKATFDALRFGALDVIAKPSRRETDSLEAQSRDIVARVKQAAAVGTNRARYRKKPSHGLAWARIERGPADGSTRFIGLGTGTSGYCALLQVIPNLQRGFQDVLIAVMWVSSRYVEPFVAYLAAHSPVPVKNIREAGTPEKGTCYVASCEDGVQLRRDIRGRFRFEVRSANAAGYPDSPIDNLFRSLATSAGSRAVGVVMSGAGKDGAEGMVAIRKVGGLGVIQSITTCMNPSMPRAVLMKGTVDKVLPDHLIPDYLMALNEPVSSGSATPLSPAAGSSSS
jgi:two-component system, chemotaxis family, protein-glutamate methylesterase/glutaminase